MLKWSTPTSAPFYNIKKEFDDKMEIISIYLIIGVLISTSIYVAADFRHWFFFCFVHCLVTSNIHWNDYNFIYGFRKNLQ